MYRHFQGITKSNCGTPPTRLEQLIALTIEEFVERAKTDVDYGNRSITTWQALIELAAHALADVVIESDFGPKEAVDAAHIRLTSILTEIVEQADEESET